MQETGNIFEHLSEFFWVPVRIFMLTRLYTSEHLCFMVKVIMSIIMGKSQSKQPEFAYMMARTGCSFSSPSILFMRTNYGEDSLAQFYQMGEGL